MPQNLKRITGPQGGNPGFLSVPYQRRLQAQRRLRWAADPGTLTNSERNRYDELRKAGIDRATARAEVRRICLPDRSNRL